MAVIPSDSTVYVNLQVLTELVEGEKVTVDHETGAFSKHVTYTGEAFGRWWSGAFNPEIVRKTFTRAFELIDFENKESATVKTYGYLSELIPAGLIGVSILKSTYKAEKKKSVSKELKNIHQQFLKVMEEWQETKKSEESQILLDDEGSDPESEASEETPPATVDIVELDVQPLIDQSTSSAKKISGLKKIFCCINGETSD